MEPWAHAIPFRSTVCALILLLRITIATMTRIQRARSSRTEPTTTPTVTAVELVDLEGASTGEMCQSSSRVTS